MDLFGPVATPSLSGCYYALCIVDDYTDRTWVYFLRDKTQSHTVLKQWQAKVERQTGRTLIEVRTGAITKVTGGRTHQLVAVRSDGGTEFQGTIGRHWAKVGVSHQTTARYSSGSNGVSERRLLTLLDRARAILNDAGVGKEYWEYAVGFAAYILDRCQPKSSVTTPFEAWYGTKPRLDHLRVPFCPMITNIPLKIQKGKTDPRGVLGVFVGYYEDGQAWKCLIPATRQIIKTRSAQFDERPPHRDLLPSPPPPTAELPLSVWEPQLSDDPPAPLPDPLLVNDPPDVAAPLPEPPAPLPIPPPVPAPSADPYFPVPPPARIQPARIRRPRSEWSGGLQSLMADDVQWALGTDPSAPLEAALCAISVDQDYPATLEAALVGYSDPATLGAARASAEWPAWEQAYEAEIQSLIAKGVVDLVPLPPGKKAVGTKPVFKTKRLADGTFDKYKVRIVAKGFLQKQGIDYTDVFAPVIKFATLRTLLALAASHDWEIEHADVKVAFLNGDPDAELYMRQPEGMPCPPGKEHWVLKLLKSIYGLKQAGRQWNKKLHGTLINMGFKQLQSDHCVYVQHRHGAVVVLAVYVDDLFPMGPQLAPIKRFLSDLGKIFELNSLGPLQSALGIRFTRNRAQRTITLDQTAYIERFLERFGMSYCSPCTTPMSTDALPLPSGNPTRPDVPYSSAVGSLMYAMLATRPDLAYTVGVLSKFNATYDTVHWQAAKRALRYMQGTKHWSLVLGGSDSALAGYTDASFGDDVGTRRSTSGYVFRLHGGTVSWRSSVQKSVAVSTVEAEYVAASDATKEAIWLRTLLTELGMAPVDTTTLHGDNQGSIALASDPTNHSRAKHIDIRYHFVRERIASKDIRLVYIPTRDMVADIMTKALARPAHDRHVTGLGIIGTLSRGEVLDIDDQAPQ